MARDAYETAMFKEKLGARIKNLRIERKLSIDGVSVLSNSSKSYIWNVENGNTEPTISKLMKIASALGTDVPTLIS